MVYNIWVSRRRLASTLAQNAMNAQKIAQKLLLTASVSFTVAGAACLHSALTDKTLTAQQTSDLAMAGLVIPHCAVFPLLGAAQIKNDRRKFEGV